jgi:hypothetical protein
MIISIAKICISMNGHSAVGVLRGDRARSGWFAQAAGRVMRWA